MYVEDTVMKRCVINGKRYCRDASEIRRLPLDFVPMRNRLEWGDVGGVQQSPPRGGNGGFPAQQSPPRGGNAASGRGDQAARTTTSSAFVMLDEFDPDNSETKLRRSHTDGTPGSVVNDVAAAASKLWGGISSSLASGAAAGRASQLTQSWFVGRGGGRHIPGDPLQSTANSSGQSPPAQGAGASSTSSRAAGTSAAHQDHPGPQRSRAGLHGGERDLLAESTLPTVQSFQVDATKHLNLLPLHQLNSGLTLSFFVRSDLELKDLCDNWLNSARQSWVCVAAEKPRALRGLGGERAPLEASMSISQMAASAVSVPAGMGPDGDHPPEDLRTSWEDDGMKASWGGRKFASRMGAVGVGIGAVERGYRRCVLEGSICRR